MNLQLYGKTALITGASSGIGAETAQVLAEEGCDIILCYNQNFDGAQKTLSKIEELGRKGWLIRIDQSNAVDIQSKIHTLPKIINNLDIVILCAGYNQITPLEKISIEEWEKVININLNGTFYMLQTIIPLLQPGASIVLVSSVSGQTGAPHHAHYSAAKAGLMNLTKSTARALSPRIRINCIAPGTTLTEMGRDTIKALPPDYATTKLLTHRFGEPREIANCIAFLASPLMGFMTGATIDINGGRYLR